MQAKEYSWRCPNYINKRGSEHFVVVAVVFHICYSKINVFVTNERCFLCTAVQSLAFTLLKGLEAVKMCLMDCTRGKDPQILVCAEAVHGSCPSNSAGQLLEGIGWGRERVPGMETSILPDMS